MNDPNPLLKLLEALAGEIALTQPDSHQGQFPILDLVGNVRDQAALDPKRTALQAYCAQFWEKLVVLVESGQPFKAEHLAWLRDMLKKVQELAGGSPVAAAPAPVAALAPAPAPTPAPAAEDPAEDSFQLNIEADGDLLREFAMESREHLDNIEQGVLVLEHSPEDAEMLNTIFRAFHTFKGSAGALNLMPVNRLAHALESLLDLARQHKLKIDPVTIDLILRGRDVLKRAVDEMEEQLSGTKAGQPIQMPVQALKSEVLAIVDAVTSGKALPAAKPAPAPAAAESTSAPASTSAAPGAAPGAKPAEAAGNGMPAPATKRAEQGGIVKVDTGKLDTLLDMVGEMVIAQSIVAQDLSGVGNLSPQFARNLAQLRRITKELQRVSMTMRMVPIRGAFQKMVRLVRDLGAKQQKKVQLLTHGEDTELDRGVVEELNDPLLHMIRNAVDHGIESSEKRAAAGKPAVATVHLRAYHQGGNIVLEIEDDGAGLNRDRILAKAVERGLVSPNAQLPDDEVFNFIFAAGFSTAEKITDVSGRGVGLDVVRRNIERLRGCVDISSKPGQGTMFKIMLPLTLAIIDGLIVKVGEERYIIPTLSVRESFRPQADMITRVQGAAEVVNVRGRLIPLLRLYDCFGIKPASTDPTQGIVVVAQAGANCRCLLVDSLLHKQEVVIKNLNELMIHKNRSLAGAAILGDGRVGLILDVNSLMQRDNQNFAQAA